MDRYVYFLKEELGRVVIVTITETREHLFKIIPRLKSHKSRGAMSTFWSETGGSRLNKKVAKLDRFDSLQSTNLFSMLQTVLLANQLLLVGLLLNCPRTEASVCDTGRKAHTVVKKESWGHFTSGDSYPQPPSDHVCGDWTIQAGQDYTITISFQDVDIPGLKNCSENYLQLGPTPLQRICGGLRNGAPIAYISNRDHVWLKYNFLGAHYIGRGFSLVYVTGHVPDPLMCQHMRFPSYHCANGKCIHKDWVCNGADECGDGSDESNCTEHHYPTPPGPYDCGVGRFGCQASGTGHYQCFPKYFLCDSVRHCMDGSDESSAQCPDGKVCSEALEGPAGSLHSPSFPSAYPAGVDCDWTIHVKLPHKIQLRFLFFHLAVRHHGGSGDYVAVYDGSGIEDRLIGRYYGTDMLPAILESTGNRMYVIFHSDHKDAEQGFNATYQQKGYCLPNQVACNWTESNCFHPRHRCDGKWDCPLHGGDERGCDRCPADQFSCQHVSPHCYHEKDRCNGANHCFNHHDDSDCSADLCNSANGTFLCSNGRCIYETWQCDRTNDCGDNSDEVGCSTTPSIKVVIAAVVGSLICGLLLVIALGCTCKLHALRLQNHHQQSRGFSSPLSAIQDEIWIRQSAPPPYNEAMVTSRPFDEVQREIVERIQQESQNRPGSRPRSRSHDQGRSRAESQAEGSNAEPGEMQSSLQPATTACDGDVPMIDVANTFDDRDDVALIDVLGGHHGPLECEQQSIESDAGNIHITVATGNTAQWQRSQGKTGSGSSGIQNSCDIDTQGETASCSASSDIIIDVSMEGNKDVMLVSPDHPASDLLSGDRELTNQGPGTLSHDQDGSDGQSLDSDVEVLSLGTSSTADL